MEEDERGLPARTIADKWFAVQEGIYRALMDSPQGSELLQRAENEDDFEVACSELAHEIICHLGDGDVEPWTKEDRKNFQIELALQEYRRAYENLQRIRGF